MKRLILRNAQVVTENGISRAEIAVEDHTITEVAPSILGVAAIDIDVLGAFVFPGFIDTHVHFNEPGRVTWEGLTTGSRALAVGGGTAFFDMPLNSDPPVLSAETLNAKRRLAEEKSLLDFALWGGLCPGHIDRIDEMAEAGAIGFKAFLCPSGIAEFPPADPATLREGLRGAKRHNLPVAVHAEDPAVLDRAAGTVSGTSMRDFLASRPKEAEIEAIRRACELAGETEATLHVVHVTCAEGLAEIASARQAGVDVSAETCPHYLLFNGDDAERLGAIAKCAPPLRSAEDMEALWDSLLNGKVCTLGSDHSPAPPEKKTGENFFEIWGGISGCQHAFPAFLAQLRRRAPDDLFQGAAWLAANPVKRFAIAGKTGHIAPGSPADLTVVDFQKPSVVRSKDLLNRHPASLYVDHTVGSQILDVIRGGEIIVKQGKLVGTSSRGTFLRPSRD
jgi:allantoinase